ncbi:MAG TPA: ABC transporter ATP-binding protein [Phycisphaerae bacterium]|nr:ABC transporter ATP-binding protein [Phycisphaerae bacterium]
MSTDRTLPPVVECVALTKVFQDFWGRDKVLAVDHLDLDVRPGEVLGLLGPNGSGKSTTIKMLLGLLYPTSGAARVFGRPPTDTAVKARIGFMPEESYLYRYLNAYETLDYYGRLFKLDRHERRKRTEQLIEMVGLKRAGRRPVGTYSKGMARRIGLAQALINDPDFLILDEPTTGLDPVGTRQIKDVIEILGERGKTVLLCSHLLADVEDVCDRVAIMYGGRRQALGPVGDLLERRDVTQITARQLNDVAIRKIREIIAQSGSDTLSVDHPTDRLESLFLRVVSQAQREKLQTSGAESTVGVSEFLGGKGGTPASLVDELVEAGRHAAPPVAVDTDVSSPPAPAPRTDLIEQLEKGKKPAPPAEVAGPIESPLPHREPDRAVLERLLQPSPSKPPPSDSSS